jgi:hypothetical protein
VHDESIHRCIHAACARTMPRRVNFCPYCGTAQLANLAKPAASVAGAEPRAPAPVATPAPAAWQPASAPAAQAQPRPEVPSHAAAASHWAGTAPPAGLAAAAASAHRASAAPRPPPPRPGEPRAATHARPPEREPIRLRWWILTLAALWAIWLTVKPTTKKIDARIDRAIALATDCKPREAQTELIALRSTKATPEQLQRVQQALNDAASVCTRNQQRDKAWREARRAVEAALAATSYEKARTRLSAFTRRWGEDDESRALKEKVDAGPREHPLADATGGAGKRPMLSARQLLDGAERDIVLGNYEAAADKMELCLTMVDPTSLECTAMKARVVRLQQPP